MSVTIFTFVPAVLDFVNALPAGPRDALFGDMLQRVAMHLPLFSIGMGWVIPSLIGLALGLILRAAAKK